MFIIGAILYIAAVGSIYFMWRRVSMWFIFILACLAVALLALFVIWVGSKVIQSIERKEKMKEIELEAYEQAGKQIRKQMEGKEE